MWVLYLALSLVINLYHCLNYKLTNFYNNQKGVNKTQHMCLAKQYSKFRSNDKVFVECEKQCPLECTTIDFNIEKSFAKFPCDPYVQLLSIDQHVFDIMGKNEIAFESLRRSMVSLKISYKDIEDAVISEQASITINDLIAYVGGTLGLVIGISVLSFLAIAEI